MSNLVYDNDWTISLDTTDLSVDDLKQYNGPFTGNGKIGMYASMTDIATSRTFISANLTFSQIGKYNNNLIQGFDLHRIKFINNIDSNITYALTSQALDMSRGGIQTGFNVLSNNVEMLNVQHRLQPLRQYPFCALQTIDFTAENDMDTLDIYHELSGNPNFINEINFNNNVIYNEKIYDEKGLYILNAEGNLNRMGSEGRPMKIAGAACYLMPSELEDTIKKLGFNVYNNLSGCYQKLRLTNVTGGTTYRFYILSAQMSGYDFPTPLDEVKRILLNIAFRTADTDTLVSMLTSENIAFWNRLWESDILLEPKLGITSGELADVKKVKQYIRYSLFNIWTSIRDGVNTEVNPLNLSYLDANGNIFFDGDLWMVPILLFLRPDMAKTILEYRYKNLEQATQLAASFGLKGSKFPYQDDVIGYQSTYWDVASPLHVFNNALIAINVWNYYRVTLDKEWLSNKGYMMMRNVADFIVSLITIDDEQGYHVNNVAGLSSRVSFDPAFTIYMFRLALKFVIEASYELNFIPKKAWTDAYLYLDITVAQDEGCGIISYDSQYEGENLDILDNLIVLLPYYSALFFDPSKPCRDNQSIISNLNFYESRINTQYDTDPLNNLLIASLYASVIQTDVAYLNTFYTRLFKTLDENVRDIWGHFNRVSEKQGNDVTLNAFLIMMFLTGIGGLTIEGGVTESKFYYKEFGIQGKFYANMPNTWKNIRLKGIGVSGQLYNVVNTRPYP
jgi:trehalose/maltose hydrolase-like predicted phosphorylase